MKQKAKKALVRLAFVTNKHQNANEKPIGSVPAYRVQCTLPPQPIYQTLLFDFLRIWLRNYWGSGWFNTIIYEVCSALHTCGVVVWICLESSWEQRWGRRLGYPPPAVASSYSSWCHGTAVVPPLPDTPAHKNECTTDHSLTSKSNLRRKRVFWTAYASCIPLKCD